MTSSFDYRSDTRELDADWDPAYHYVSIDDVEPQEVAASNGWARVLGLSALVVMAIWVAVTSIYIMLHDDLVGVAIDERTRMQAAYEQRIARLQSELDLASSRLMLNQDAYDARLAQLASRQAILEERQTQIAALAGTIEHPALKSARADDDTPHDQRAEAAAAGTTITLAFASRADARRRSRLPASVLPDADLPDRPANPTELDLATVAAAQERLEARQQEQLNAIETMAESATADFSSVIGRLGLSPLGEPEDEDEGTSDGASDGLSGVPEGIGGPFVPAVAAPGDLSQGNLLQGVAFERQVERARSRLDYAVALHNQLLDLPIRRPLQKPLYVTSPFGNRSDPFRRSKAFHSGMDLRAATGVPVLATGPGEVVKAGWGGAYGWMVEIRHASGLTTRYAHMSSVAVSTGERVEPGDMVGRVGSSGRSTGPHLHYETRLGADAVNPQRFFRIGDAYAR